MSRHQPILTPEQEKALFEATGRRVVSVVTAARCPKIDEQVGDCAALPVLGAFVSLKKEGRLRSCMGVLADPIPLAEAVEAAAVRSAKDDPRFPPITAAELSDLEMEVWILWGMEPILEHGRDRAKHVEIGRHGLQIIHGANRGLLLPGVAVEHRMNVEQFLEAACQKAGLPKNAWYDNHATLLRFEGRAISGRIGDIDFDKATALELKIAGRYQWKGTEADGPSLADVESLRQICVQNLKIMRDGGSPDRFYPGLFDGKVSGVSVAMNIPGRPQLLCSKVMIRPEIPLQSSLLEMVRLVADQAEKEGITPLEMQEARLDLGVFWNPEIHGNAESCDLSRLDTVRRSLMLSSPVGWVLHYHPTASPETQLADGIEYLHLDDPGGGEVLSMETACTAETLLVTNISRRDHYPPRRPPALAGAFYPATPADIQKELDRLFAGQPTQEETRVPGIDFAAVLIPHAGWVYSGVLAAETLAQVLIPERVLVFCPKHRPGGLDWAVAPHRFWDIPGGTIPSDPDLAARLTAAVDLFQFDPIPHRQEHAIEVQLPLLQRLRPDVKVVGVTMSTATWPVIAEAAAQMAQFLENLPGEKPLLVISSDLNHFSSEEMTRIVDQIAIDAMLVKNPEQLLTTVRENGISMCGVTAAAFVLETLRLMGRLNTATLVGHTTSAKHSGDYSRVVGYAGMLFR